MTGYLRKGIGKLMSDLHLLDQVLMSGSTFALQIALAALMGLEEFGRFSNWQILVLIILGFQQSFFISVHQVNFRIGKSTGARYSSGIARLHLALVTFVVLILGVIAGVSDGDTVLFIQGMALCCWLFFDILRRLAITENRMRNVVFADGVYLFLLAFGLIGLLLNDGLESINAIAIIGLAYGFGAIYLWLKMPMRSNSFASWLLILQMHWNQAKWLLATQGLQMFGTHFYVLSCGWWLGAASLGALRLVQSIFGVFGLFFQYFENKHMPPLSASSDSFELWTQQMHSLQQQMHRFGKLMFTVSVVGLLATTWFLDSTMLMLIGGFLVLQVLIVLGIPIRMGIRSQKQNKSIFIAYILSSTLTIVTAYPLINGIGVAGAVLGLCLAQMVMLIYWNNILKTKYHLPWKLYM